MLTITDDITIDAPVQRVFETFWRPQLWPEITRHVKRIEMVRSGALSQRFRMLVESDGRQFESESARTAQPYGRIAYVQLRTPPIFVRHCGEWLFSVDATEMTHVSLKHEVVLADRASEVLGTEPGAPTESLVTATLRRNGALTMQALKRWIEAVPNRGAA